MKRNLLLFAMLISVFAVQAQNETYSNLNEKKNEIKLNVISPLLGGIEMSYERILNKKSGLGISALYIFSDENNEDTNYMISTNYRRYFGKKYASGFFAEGFGMFSSIDGKQLKDIDGNLTSNEGDDVYDLSIGLGLGSKWVTKSGFIFEINAGYGFLLFNADKTDHTIVAKLGLNVGYRF
ncbi:DUF3575 domain-containing protein [Psychroflexus halocasei]|uniref:DUF3575 domain-containing protein n=1 Tax=Psychroflexus halocasei TaxID=908615 RepID=A0A1H4E694_9FLAO|nr:DUF3575 domain-containing protein [Psychroflexus halocasei]SEA80575.1 Protein of unknown function [Psychroflexus halocasei]